MVTFDLLERVANEYYFYYTENSPFENHDEAYEALVNDTFDTFTDGPPLFYDEEGLDRRNLRILTKLNFMPIGVSMDEAFPVGDIINYMGEIISKDPARYRN